MFKQLILFVITLSFSITAVAGNGSYTKQVDSLEGILSSQLARLKDGLLLPFQYSNELMYNQVYPLYNGALGLNAKTPLQINLKTTQNSKCKNFYLDKDYSFDEMMAFMEEHIGAKVQLRNVQLIYKNNQLSYCTFSDIEILETREALSLHEKKQEKPTNKSIVYEGNLDVVLPAPLSVGAKAIRSPRSVHGALTTEEWYKYCGNYASFQNTLSKEQVREIRVKLKQSGGKATLNNVKIIEGECTLESIKVVTNN